MSSIKTTNIALSSIVTENAKANIDSYWQTEYFKNKSMRENNNYIFDIPDATLYLIGDIEGDFAMIYNWFLEKKILDIDLNWIAPKDVYVIQAGDQVDKYNLCVRDQRGRLVHPPRRQRTPDLVELVSDFDTVVFFDYLAYASKKAYGSERVFSVLGNHEFLNLQGRYHHAVNCAQSEEDYKSDLIMYESVMNANSIKSPIVQIFNKRPVILRFNSLVVCHAGLNQEAITNYINHLQIQDFDIDEFIIDNNKYKNVINYSVKDEYYNKVLQHLIWNREYDDPGKTTTITEPALNDKVIVLGHNSYDNIIFCNQKTCSYANNYTDSLRNLKVIKIDTGMSSRPCKNNNSDIFTARLNFKNGEIVSYVVDYYGFKCAEGEYPRISFAPSKELTKFI